MTKDELRSVLPGGKNHEVAMKWLNDDKAVLQWRDPAFQEGFQTITSTGCPNFKPILEWRIKPEVLRYRVALMMNSSRSYIYLAYTASDEMFVKASDAFVKWVSDWQEVEV